VVALWSFKLESGSRSAATAPWIWARISLGEQPKRWRKALEKFAGVE
jgi:hypothetical protein